MSEEKMREMFESLLMFVKRVSSDQKASPAEIVALPEVARILLDSNRYYC